MAKKPYIKSADLSPNQRRGRKSKTKGKAFEREIVNRLREAGVPAKRGWAQSMGGSRIPDVIVDGFWLECGDGINMDPRKKLAQACADVATHAPESKHFNVLPFAITHQKGCRSIEVTSQMRYWIRLWEAATPVLIHHVTGQDSVIANHGDALMTMDLEDFIPMVKYIRFPGDVDMGTDDERTSNSKGWKIKDGEAKRELCLSDGGGLDFCQKPKGHTGSCSVDPEDE